MMNSNLGVLICGGKISRDGMQMCVILREEYYVALHSTQAMFFSVNTVTFWDFHPHHSVKKPRSCMVDPISYL